MARTTSLHTDINGNWWKYWYLSWETQFGWALSGLTLPVLYCKYVNVSHEPTVHKDLQYCLVLMKKQCANLNLWLKLWQWATSKCYINILNSCIVKTLQGLDWEADENQGCQFWVNKMNKTHCTNATQIQDKYIHVDVCTACLWAWATGMLPRTEKSLFTESMTPRRAWKPPNTGNTCSMVSAMVASYKGREVETDREVWKEERGQKK